MTRSSATEAEPIRGIGRWIVGARPHRTLIRIGVLIVACYVVFKFVLLPIRVTGISMEPTYRDRAFNLVNRWSYQWSRPKRGDVVGLRLVGERVMLMKRVVALPGERMSIRAGDVYINGELLDEPYAWRTNTWFLPEVRLQTNEYFVVGDNRSMPQENHTFRVVKDYRIVGKVLF